MDSRRVISLLLAGQMLSAPLAQASALSPTRRGDRGYPRLSLQTGRTVSSAATYQMDPDTAVVTPTPEATPAATPAPPEATPAVTPAPEATPAVSAVQALNGVMAVDASEIPTKEFDFNTAYIGFGYEIYYADMPATGAEDYAAKPAGKYVFLIEGGRSDEYVADFAVEKPLNTTEEIEKAAFFENKESDTGLGIWLDEDDWVGGWRERADGSYSAEDVNFLRVVGEVDYSYIYEVVSLNDIAEWLGRIPDYKFSGWYVSALSPSQYKYDDQYSSTLWDGYEDYAFRYQISPDGSPSTASNSISVTRIPLAYYSGEDRADYPLTEPGDPWTARSLSREDMRVIRDQTVVNFENYSPVYREKSSIPFYPGTKMPYYGDPRLDPVPEVDGSAYNTPYMEVELPIIAHWELSNDATLVASVPLNHENVAQRSTVNTAVYAVKNGEVTTENLLDHLYNKAFTNSDTQKADFDYENSQTYYLCVDGEIEAIAPQFLATEAFHVGDAPTAGGGVTISFRAAGETKENAVVYNLDSADHKLSYTLLNSSKEVDGTDYIYNNAKYPLRSQWTVASAGGALGTLPLTRATGGDSVEDRYNEMVVTVTAPDGTTTNVYTFYIERLNDPYVVQNYGNTPIGMIARESDAGWNQIVARLAELGKSATIDQVRETARNRFMNGYFGYEDITDGSTRVPMDGRSYSFNRSIAGVQSPENLYYPRDDVENNGGHYELNAVYAPKAWGKDVDAEHTEGNIDLDDKAIIVYQDSSFVDPGVTVYDSEGRKVDFSEGNVKRSLILRTAASGLQMSQLSDAYGVKSYYTGKSYGEDGRMETAGADVWEVSFQTVKDGDDNRIDLRGLNVVPGVYTMEYRFTDPMRKYTAAGEEQNFDSKATSLFADNVDLATTFTRTVVVLPLPGDVNMDGLVTIADAEALYRELDSESGKLKEDSFLNSDDKTLSLFHYRVCDVNYDGEIDSKDVAALTKEYIPVFARNVTCDKYYYIPLRSGMSAEEEAAWHVGQPWDGSTTPQEGKGAISLEYIGLNETMFTDGEPKGAAKGDIVWVGVKVDLTTLTDANAALKRGVAALKLSLVYDANYLEPAVLDEAARNGDTSSQWLDTLRAYNISGASTNDPELWPETYELVEDGCRVRVSYDFNKYYFRSTPVIGTIPGDDRDRVKVLTVVLRDTAGAEGHRQLTDTAYLLRIPFQVKAVEYGASVLEGLELSLSAQDMGALVESPERAAVWSAQTEPVFGGVSANLADELTYVGGSARSIPLVETSLEDAVELVNTRNEGKSIYGEEYVYVNYSTIGGQDAASFNLPKGLTYTSSLGRIEGIIEETGTFAFSLTNKGGSVTFYITVEKAPLTLYAVPQERYYGEPVGDLALEFRYDPDDIRPLDRPGGNNYVDGFENDGSAEELSKVEGYTAPTVTATVAQGENAGTYYDISITNAEGGSGLKNYAFVYADVTLDNHGTPVVGTETKTAATSPLTILPRPLVVGQVADATLDSLKVTVDTGTTIFRDRTASYQNGRAELLQGFEPVTLSGNDSYPDYKDRLTDDAIYGEDEVTLTFTARLQPENTTPPYYDLDGAPSKQVVATVADLKLAETPTNANYELIGIVDDTAHVTVTGNAIVSIAMSGWNRYSGYSSGDTISFNFMQITVTYEDGKTRSTVYLGDDATLDPDWGHIYITWVSAEDKEQRNSHYADADHLLKHGQEMLTGVHNGMYLCVTVLQGGEPISWFSDTPFEVLKQKITLTAKPLTVYYGEYQDDMLDYTYNPNDLTPSDYQALAEKLGHAPTGSSEELATPGVEGLANFVAPVLSAWSGEQGTSESVSADTSVQWEGGNVVPSKIYIENKMDGDGETILSGAGEYRFVFTGGPAGQESKYGVSDLNILPRPIMVDTVTIGAGSQAFLYDDTTDWVLRQMYYTEDGTPVAHPVTLTGRAPDAAESADTFAARAYSFSQDQGRDVYYVAGSTSPVPLEAPNPTGDAIHRNKDGKLDEVVITYVATYQRDVTSAYPPETSYFTMDGKATKTVPVTVNGLALPKELGDNGNYKLVYRLLRLANSTSPENAQTTGVVKLRAIKKVEIAADANEREYTYGELMNLDGMTLHVTYESEGDNNLNQNMARNVIQRTSYYSDTGDGSDTFAHQGLQLYWKVDPSLTVQSDTIEDSVWNGYLTQSEPAIVSTIVTAGEDVLGRYPDVAKTGKTLLVCGRRFDGDTDDAAHPLVWAEGSKTFTINKKTLPLTVMASNRYYGEPNRNYRASYALSDLSLTDQRALGDAGYTADSTGRFYISAERDTETGGRDVSKNVVLDLDLNDGVNDELAWLNQGYLNPGEQTSLGVRFTSPAVQASNVGSYSVSMEPTASSNMANYKFDRYTPGNLRVFRRPIVIEEILEKLPTIYYNTPETEFPAMVERINSSTGSEGFRAGLPTLTNGSYDNSAKDPEIRAAVNAGMAAAMSLSGNAIYGSDGLALNMTVVYPAVGERNGFAPGEYQVDQEVTVKDLELVDGSARNYFLVYNSATDEFYRRPADPNAWGQLDKRPIIGIEVLWQESEPKMEYTYGETLNLSRLKLKVTYGVIDNESYPRTDDLFYSQLTGRLSVNYWENEEGTSTPKPLPTAKADYYIGTLNRPAKTGDHLTIAPAHDAGTIDGESTSFAHNGKYLILTARADEALEWAAPPVLVNNGGTPVPITVKPLDLTYTLAAGDRDYNDKAYASRTATSGTISLTNVYGTTETYAGEQGETVTVLDRDLVYVAADRVFTRDELAGLVNDAYKLSEDAYVFSVDGADQSDRMAFDFYDENVMYYEGEYTPERPMTPEEWVDYWNSGLEQHNAKRPGEEGWNSYGDVAPMPVLVSGLRLEGPDAANYTLDEWVGRKDDVAAIFNAATATAAKDQVPYAVMNKAVQSISAAERPLLSVDDRTNTVRLTYQTQMGAVRPDLGDARPDDFSGEYHFQYGLEYQETSGETPSAMEQWGEWSDHTYFGGEKLTVTNDPSYVPSETPGNNKEEETIVKGQNYPWEAEDVDAVTGKSLFGTRERLERDTVYWGMVRLAETHNYLPSEPVRAYLVDGDDPTVAQASVAEQREAALRSSEEISQAVLNWVTDRPKGEHPELPLGPAPAVKTYTQSFEIISTEEVNQAGGARYNINTLEAVWFTDIQKYTRQDELSAVLRNIATTRYYNFYWDQDKSASVNIGADGLDLSQEEIWVEVNEKQPDGSTARVERRVNLGDDPEKAPRPYSAVLYVTVINSGGMVSSGVGIGGGGGGGASGEEISELSYVLAHAPVVLEARIKPAAAMKEGLIWTSADSRIVQVDQDGKLFFVGIGTTEVTVTTKVTRRTATVKVTVTSPGNQEVGAAWSAALALDKRAENRFNFYLTKPFMALDRDYMFNPEQVMTRSELVMVLSRFYQAAKNWRWDGKSAFTDLSGSEEYAETAELLRVEGILEGLPDGTFGGEKTATRAEVATILCRMMGIQPLKRSGASKRFEDCGDNYAWANGYIDALAVDRVVKGTDDTHFTPEREITRVELAAMLGRVLLTGIYFSDSGEPPLAPIDVADDHWAYELILRAVNVVIPRTI